MLGNPQAIMKQSCATCMSFACFEMYASSATPTQCRNVAEASMMTLVSFFVSVLLSVLPVLVLVHLVLVRCLTGLVNLYSLVGLTAQRASAARQGV